MLVTRDKRYVDICARVDSINIKVGKAMDFATRKNNYYKDFDAENVVFEPWIGTKEIRQAETVVLRALKSYRKISPKGGKLEWLEGISYEDTKRIALEAIMNSGIVYEVL